MDSIKPNAHTDASMSLPFVVSAPGKVIVFGEHAVVHGKAAMAAAVSLRSYLHVSPTPNSSESTITLDFIDISLRHTWAIASLPWSAFASARSSTITKLPASIDPDLLEALGPHVKSIGDGLPSDKAKLLQSAALTFLYLYLLLASETTTPCTFTLRSTIPIGAGLGSSASVQVCLATALLFLTPQPQSSTQPLITLPPAASQTLNPDSEAVLERINALAFLGESIIHGVASGVDNTVATLGKAIIFKRSPTPGQPATITSLHSFPELPLLIIDTKQSKSTAAEVAKVRDMLSAEPAVTTHILDAIDAVTESARNHIAAEQVDTPARLAALVRVNHALLASLGVSHPRLELLRSIVDDAGIGAFKLTGAGGGGCGFVLLRPGVARGDGALAQVEQRVEEEGMQKFETLLGGPGVGVKPAAIGREEFVSAEGAEGLMELVGREGWLHWRQ